MAQVRFPRLLDPVTGGRRTVEIAAGTLGDLRAALEEAIPGVGQHLFLPGGSLRPHVLCFVDGSGTRLADPSEPLGDDADIRFLQAVSGGSDRG